MKWVCFFFGVLSIAILACGPGFATTKDATLTVTAFVDENGKGVFVETYTPLPNTLVIAKWNQNGHMLREVKLTDQNGQAAFSARYTHFFDVSVIPPCGYYPTSPLFRDVRGTEKTEFGFWPVEPGNQLSRIRVMLWKDLNADGKPDPAEGVVNEKTSLMFKAPGGADGNVYDEDNFVSESQEGWFDVNLGNSCGTVYVILLNSALTTNSVSEPGRVSDAGSHGNTFYPAIEIPYDPGETTIYWEIGAK
jgi:hypothetical protein